MNRIFRLVLRTQVTRARLIGLLSLGAVLVLIALAIRAEGDADGRQATFDLADGFGLALLAPVVALVFASASLGDLVDDRTLVYVWLRPVPRWQIVGGALAASLCVSLPVAVVPVVLAVLIGGGGGEVAGAAAAATALAVVGYSALFVGLGFKVQRALVWGLAYLLIWEGAVARAAAGAARLSVQAYARSAMADLAGFLPPKPETTVATAVVVVALASAAAYAITVQWVTNAEVA